MNYVMLQFFSQRDGFAELKIHKTRGILEMKVA
jgi:hypothetical protein